MWQGRETSVQFGDVFGTREDYRKGTFYAGRREFLHSAGKNVLEPPPDFKTKKQMRNYIKIKKGGGINFQKLTFDFKEKEGFQATGANQVNKNKPETKKSQKAKKMIIVERFSSTAKEDWQEEFQAGCRLWVNRSTGEVSDFCPWEDEDDLSNSSQQIGSPMKGNESTYSGGGGVDDDWGPLETSSASLDYDSTEIAELMHMLDTAPKSPSMTLLSPISSTSQSKK